MMGRLTPLALAVALAACADRGAQPDNTCFTTTLSVVSGTHESMVAAGRTFVFLSRAITDLRKWRPNDSLRICEYLEPHEGPPIYQVTNTQRNETLLVTERRGE